MLDKRSKNVSTFVDAIVEYYLPTAQTVNLFNSTKDFVSKLAVEALFALLYTQVLYSPSAAQSYKEQRCFNFSVH